MKLKRRKVIISCAITGSVHTPSMSEFLPAGPEQIAQQAIDAARAGAAILHLHARNPADGSPTPDPAVFQQFVPKIAAQTDAIINITTGGSSRMTLDDRLAYPLRQARAVLAQYGIDELRLPQGRRRDLPTGNIPGKRAISKDRKTSSSAIRSPTSAASLSGSARRTARASSSSVTTSGTSAPLPTSSTRAC